MSEEYQSFRGSIPLKNITVEEDKTWQVFDTGPKSQESRQSVSQS